MTSCDLDSDSTIENSVFAGRGKCWQEKEQRRLQDVYDYELENYDINDKGLQAITNLAASMTDMPLAFITLVREKFVPFLSRSGCDLTGTEREFSFCDVAIEQTEFFEVCDSTVDPRFKENVFVQGQQTPLTYYGGFPIKTPNGNHLGSLCVVDYKKRKLTESQKTAIQTLADQVIVHLELKKKNKKLEEALQKAEKLSRAKDDFVSNMSHELRTPLNAINGFAEVLSKSNLDFEQKEAVGIIKSSCEILITLINDILDFSKIESGKLAIERVPFNLHKACKNIRDLLSKKADEKNNKIILEIDDRIPINLMGDKVRINQIIVNLVGNALKFTEKGKVTLSVSTREETDQNITLDFSIKDTGIGIPEDKLESIFERFEQVGKETTRKYGGTGLGLNISKNLVEMHGGMLKVKSKLGVGSEFYFTITYDKVNEEEQLKKDLLSKKNNLPDVENLENIRILICEDNIVNIKLIRNLFKNKLSHIEIAENGKIAIEILRKNNNFDVILMDIHMPEMDGIEATKFIRNHMKLKIPIIGFTANSSKTERDLCLTSGMNDYVTKTFVPEDFYEKLSKAIPMKKKYAEDFDDGLLPPKRRCSSTQNAIMKYQDYFQKNLKPPTKRGKGSSSNLTKKSLNKTYKSGFISKSDENTEKKIIDSMSSKASKFSTTTMSLLESCAEVKEASPIQVVNNYMFVDFSNDDEPKNEIYDSSKLKEVSGDDIDFEKEIIELFLDDFPRQMEKLEDAIRNMNKQDIHFCVHKMKSPLSMLGFTNILERLVEIEKMYDKETSGTLLKEFDKVEDEVENSFKQLKFYINTIKV